MHVYKRNWGQCDGNELHGSKRKKESKLIHPPFRLPRGNDLSICIKLETRRIRANYPFVPVRMHLIVNEQLADCCNIVKKILFHACNLAVQLKIFENS